MLYLKNEMIYLHDGSLKLDNIIHDNITSIRVVQSSTFGE